MFGRWGRALGGDNLPEIEVDELITRFGQAANQWGGQPIEELLIRATLADACRDAGVRPVNQTLFTAFWRPLQPEDRQRVAIFAEAFDLPPVQKALAARCRDAPDAAPGLGVLKALVTGLPFLTPEVLMESDIRLEEFARHFCAAWRLRIANETEAHSAERLHEIDFDRLMKEAELARSSADERLAYVRKLQAEQEETRRPRRGKW